MKFDFKATNQVFERQFIKLRRRYSLAVQRLRNDILLRDGLAIKAQREVNQRLKIDEKGR